MCVLPRLDERLACIAQQVPACELAADIGADHGKLSCWLLLSGRVQRMIVSDISRASRDKARDLLMSHDLMDRVCLSDKDGLHALREKPQTIIIAGMGGSQLRSILLQNVDLSGARLVLSAQAELPLVRDALADRRYQILHETLVRAGGRYYRVITAEPGYMALTAKQRILGFNVQASEGVSLEAYYRWQMQVASIWQGDRGAVYRAYLREELNKDG